MANTEDPLDWIRESPSQLWDYDRFVTFTVIYTRARRWQQLEAKSVLPDLDAQTRIVRTLRSPDREN